MNKIVQHIFNAIRFENTKELIPVFDKEIPIKSTSRMVTWYTSKPCELTEKSHISHVVFDSSWEASEAFELDRNKEVISWAKNDHLGFVINYVYRGVIHKFYPDFLIGFVQLQQKNHSCNNSNLIPRYHMRNYSY